MLEQTEFLEEYKITADDFEKSGLDWFALMDIYSHYKDECTRLEPVSEYISETLRKVQNVHTVKHRVKNPEHLVEKIIRKKLEKPEIDFTVDSYRYLITDLIGIRALHLFKEDWLAIHQFISENWELVEKPKAIVRDGDDKKMFESYIENGFDTVEHPFGYRSLHYLIKSKPYKQEVIAEIQVRTIFEEGWSEIDHLIRYPYDIDNPILGYYLVLFNRLAGNADEMGSYVRFLKNELDNINRIHQHELQEKDQTIAELESKINELEIDSSEKEELKKTIATLRKQTFKGVPSSIEIKLPAYKGPLQELNEKILGFRSSSVVDGVMPPHLKWLNSVDTYGKIKLPGAPKHLKALISPDKDN